MYRNKKNCRPQRLKNRQVETDNYRIVERQASITSGIVEGRFDVIRSPVREAQRRKDDHLAEITKG